MESGFSAQGGLSAPDLDIWFANKYKHLGMILEEIKSQAIQNRDADSQVQAHKRKRVHTMRTIAKRLISYGNFFLEESDISEVSDV